MAAPTHTEILLVALGKLREIGQVRAREFLNQHVFLTVAWDEELADQAAVAFARFGKGHHASRTDLETAGDDPGRAAGDRAGDRGAGRHNAMTNSLSGDSVKGFTDLVDKQRN